MGLRENETSASPEVVTLHVCIPALNESAHLPDTLACLMAQEDANFRIYICVNQPESWWNREDKIALCEDNQRTLSLLRDCNYPALHIIDHSSKGLGWKGKQGGVGWARKVLMDTALDHANEHDIIVSLDADTTFNKTYLSAVRECMLSSPTAAALSVPYYHKLTGDEKTDRAILRYEIYMRYYAIQLFRIKNPYAFTALGSAIAVPVRAYRAVGGMTPKHSGEDFYFLQKLRKFGSVMNYFSEKVFPMARFSDRVNFGTGPAMIKGASGDWESYPIYHSSLFDKVKKTFDLFPALYLKDTHTPMSSFIMEIFREENPWQPLRNNYPSQSQFVKACMQKIDGLRILQYLKTEHKKSVKTDEGNLRDFFKEFYTAHMSLLPEDFSYLHAPIEKLQQIRDFLESEEIHYRKMN